MSELKPELYVPLSAARQLAKKPRAHRMTKALDPLAAMARETTDLSGLAVRLGGPNAITSLGPGIPIGPAHPEEQYPRQWDYTPGYNIGVRPRSYETFDYSTLYALANNWDVAGLCIEKRKDDFVKHPWVIRPRAVENQGRQDRLARQVKYEDAVAEATGFFMTPDQINPWSSWVSKWMDDLWKGDSATVYLHRNRGGGLYAAEIPDGQTIRPVVDLWGRRPLVPPDTEPHVHDWQGSLASGMFCAVCGCAPAYCQVIKGMNWTWYGSDEIIWQPRWLRGQGPYGHPPAEWIILSINRALRRQSLDLSMYTEGTIPAGYVKFPETWTTQQGLDFLTAVNGMFAGNDIARSRLMPIPGGPNSGVENVHPEAKSEFEEFLLHIGCAAYGQSPVEMGFIRGGTGQMGVAKSGAEIQSISAQERDVSLANHFKWAVLDRILATFWDPALEFIFTDLVPAEDRHEQAEMDKFAVSVGAISPDWIAEHRYDTDGPGLSNTIVTGQGQVMLVSEFLKSGGGTPLPPPPGAPPTIGPARAMPAPADGRSSPPPSPSAEPGVATSDSPGAPKSAAKAVKYKGDLAKIVHEYLLRSYPPKDVEWVLDPDVDWEYDPKVKLDDINYARRPGGRNPEKVASIEDTVSAGASIDPVVLTDLDDPAGLVIADGWHRILGVDKAGEDEVPAFIATGKLEQYADTIRKTMQADSMNLAKADLSKWERKATKALKLGKSAGVAFVSDAIPPAQEAVIRVRLAMAKTAADVHQVFAKADPLGEPERPLPLDSRQPVTSSPQSGQRGSVSRVRSSPGHWGTYP